MCTELEEERRTGIGWRRGGQPDVVRVPLLASDRCVEKASGARDRLDVERTWESLRRRVPGSQWLSQVSRGTTYLVPLCYDVQKLFLVHMWL